MDCSPLGFGPWDFSAKNTGMGYHFLLQRIFPIQESNPPLLLCRWILYCWASRKAPKFIHIPTIWTSHFSLRYLPKRNESRYPYEDSHMNVQSSLFVLASNWKQPKCSSAAEYIHQQCFIHTKQYYTVLKKNELLKSEHGWILRHHAEWKKSDTVECLLNDPIYAKFKNKKNWSVPTSVRSVLILSGS